MPIFFDDDSIYMIDIWVMEEPASATSYWNASYDTTADWDTPYGTDWDKPYTTEIP